MSSQGQYGQDLVDAVLTRDAKKVRSILRKGADLDFVRRGDTPIHLAARQGDLDIISALLRAGDSVNKGNQNGNTPLHFVARDGRDDIVRYLISKGADINIQNEDGDTPLHASVGYQPMDLIEYYVSIGMEVNKQNNSGDTPLHVAVSHSRDESVEALLLSDADVNIANNQGKRAYELARREDISDQIKTYDLLKAAKDSGYIMAEGTKLRHKDVEVPFNLQRVGITMMKMSLDPNSCPMTFFYCRREKSENSSVSFQLDPEEEVVSDVYHFRVRDVIDEITASFTIPLYSEPSDKQQVVLKFIAGRGGTQTITKLIKVEENVFCTIETILVPETTSVLLLYLCAKCEDNVIGEQAQHISSELEENFTMDIPEGAFQPDTVISLKVFDINETEAPGEEAARDDDCDKDDDTSDPKQDTRQDTDTATNSNTDNKSKQNTKDDAFLEQYTDSNELLNDADGDKKNPRSTRKSRKRKAKVNLMSDVFQINIDGEQPAKNVKMQLPLTDDCEKLAASDLQIVRVNDDNNKDFAILPCETDEKGDTVNFETEHFCTFVICPKMSDITKIIEDINNAKLRRQEARFFAMVQVNEDETEHVLVVECIKSDMSRKRRSHWNRKGFTKQKPKQSSSIVLTPSQEFSIELTGDARFDTQRGETGQRKLVFSPHRASFQPYRIKLPRKHTDGKASVHIYTEIGDDLDTESVADSELGPLTDARRKRVAKLRIKLPLPPEEDPYGPEVEEAFTHETTNEIWKWNLRMIWLKMLNFLRNRNKPLLLKQQQAQQALYLKKRERLARERQVEREKRERMREEFPSNILSGSVRSVKDF